MTPAGPGAAALTARDLRRAAEAILVGGVDAGAAVLAPFAYRSIGPVKLTDAGAQTTLTPKQLLDAQVLERDRFRCRYCHGRLVPRVVHELFATLYPDLYPYHSNGKKGYYHPAQWWLEYARDHVNPKSGGGADTADNCVAACWWHNDRKRDTRAGELPRRPIGAAGRRLARHDGHLPGGAASCR